MNNLIEQKKKKTQKMTTKTFKAKQSIYLKKVQPKKKRN